MPSHKSGDAVPCDVRECSVNITHSGAYGKTMAKRARSEHTRGSRNHRAVQHSEAVLNVHSVSQVATEADVVAGIMDGLGAIVLSTRSVVWHCTGCCARPCMLSHTPLLSTSTQSLASASLQSKPPSSADPMPSPSSSLTNTHSHQINTISVSLLCYTTPHVRV